MTVTTFLGDDSPGQRPAHATRPVVMGRRGVVTSGHYLATAAGFRIMEQGGNAIDAASLANRTHPIEKMPRCSLPLRSPGRRP